MSWTDHGLEKTDTDFKAFEAKLSLESAKQVDMGSVYRWDKFLTVIHLRGHRQYNANVEYLARHGEVVRVIVTCLDEPMADYDITDSLPGHELERVMDLAERDLECKPSE